MLPLTRNFSRQSVINPILNRSLPTSTSILLSSNYFSTSTTSNQKDSIEDEGRTTHFGYQTVKENDKKPMVASVFHNVADRYDLMNDAMSGGIHRCWKDYFVQQLNPMQSTKLENPLRLIDVAGGTGDIAFRLAEKLKENGMKSGYIKPEEKEKEKVNDDEKEQKSYKEYDIVVCDINEDMLRVGKERARKKGYIDGITPSLTWIQGDAEQLQYDSNSFDAYTIAFGIRNVTHIDKVLSEAYRVLKKGGRFMCLEFSQVTNPLLRQAYDMYSFNVIPAMGQLLANDRPSYQYLVESIRQFPNQEKFKAMIEDAGFEHVRYENLTFGVVAIHSGFKV